jgi:tRNA (cytosine38-C5)-methyltransferase
LLHIINLLEGQLKCIPEFLFLENVPNFEFSEQRNKLIQVLIKLEFQINEFIVSPLDYGIPNDRKRYYLTAKRIIGKPGHIYPLAYSDPHAPQISISPMHAYLQHLDDSSIQDYLVPEGYLAKRFNFRHDIISSESQSSATITKAYGTHHLIGSGSLLQTDGFDQEIDFKDVQTLMKLKLRFLTPTEIARLHALPIDLGQFKFPEKLSIKQRYKLLGNSLNVHVVYNLFMHHLFNH